MPTPVTFDPVLGCQFIKYARLVAGRGYVHNTLGNMVMRSPHPDFAHGLAYTKHAEISLEEMEVENIVITDVPTSRIVRVWCAVKAMATGQVVEAGDHQTRDLR